MERSESFVAGVIVLVTLALAAGVAALMRESSRRELLTTTIRRSEPRHPRRELLAQ